MDPKPVDETIISGTNRSQNFSKLPENNSIFCNNMKRSASELDLEEFLRPTISSEIIGDSVNQSLKEERIGEFRAQRVKIWSESDAFFSVQGQDKCFENVFAAGDVNFTFRDRDTYGFSSTCGGLPETLVWSQNLTPKNSSISITIDSQSSMCAGSPSTAHKPKINGDHNQAQGGTSGSSGEQSDEDEREIEAGPCEQSMDPMNIKNIRRKVSNRESARRSRNRKQAHLAGLELQVEKLRVENASLFKQLADADRQFGDAATDNRFLKSDVEALRVKVKLAEDMVARGSLTCSLNHLLQTNSSPLPPLSNNSCRPEISLPALVATGGDESSYIGSLSGQISSIGLENRETHNENNKNRPSENSPPLQRIASLEQLQNRMISEAVSCMSEMLPWETLVPPVSKQI